MYHSLFLLTQHGFVSFSYNRGLGEVIAVWLNLQLESPVEL